MSGLIKDTFIYKFEACLHVFIKIFIGITSQQTISQKMSASL